LDFREINVQNRHIMSREQFGKRIEGNESEKQF